MTGDTKKKIFKKPSRKTLLISGAVVIVCAAAWLIFGQGIVGDKNVEFKQLSKDDVPKSIETEVIPEYRELERALGCLIDGKVYVIVTVARNLLQDMRFPSTRCPWRRLREEPT